MFGWLFVGTRLVEFGGFLGLWRATRVAFLTRLVEFGELWATRLVEFGISYTPG
jgi:hypothetical protein